MAQQKSEDRDKPAGRRKSVVTHAFEKRAGGEAIPVDEEPEQLLLFVETADAPARAGGCREAVRPVRTSAPPAAPKPTNNEQRAQVTMMEEVTRRLDEAFDNVERNQGAPGPDRKTLSTMRKHIDEWMPTLHSSLLTGTYTPGNIRRVWIPKASGGQRGLGIPNVIDRVVQEAVRLVLEPLYEPTFHGSSHGFRPERSCHTAIAEACRHVNEGYEWVVDLDLEKFFDRVNHQRLMSTLAQRIDDKPLLVLIGRMLKAKVVLPDGLVMPTEEGVPQGGPLSPLLSNIVLDELDRELERRGHRFVRYADDCNIYVRSERAGERVMASIKQFIERRLRLKVNEKKSAVSRPEERHFLGFRLRSDPLGGSAQVMLSKRSVERFGEKLLQLTPRNYGNSMDACIHELNQYLRGWIGFFGICTNGAASFRILDGHIRRRLRALQLRQWKRKRTIARRLISMGIRAQTAWRGVYGGRKSWWALSHSSPVERALRNSYWDARGLVSLVDLWTQKHHASTVHGQQTLAFG
jgi:RNA-directed DNA polymerase